MKMNLKKGFTLIELLVVVAIIGILASVVLASLNTARQKGADAAVKAQMASIAAQAEVFYDDTAGGNGGYAGLCSNSVVVQAIAVIDANDSATPACNVMAGSGATVQKWAISTTLKSGTTWCVDNSGWKKAGTAAAGVCS
jgi:prepilin-type N-terminal cleavage/methylation domain-containing protein